MKWKERNISPWATGWQGEVEEGAALLPCSFNSFNCGMINTLTHSPPYWNINFYSVSCQPWFHHLWCFPHGNLQMERNHYFTYFSKLMKLWDCVEPMGGSWSRTSTVHSEQPASENQGRLIMVVLSFNGVPRCGPTGGTLLHCVWLVRVKGSSIWLDLTAHSENNPISWHLCTDRFMYDSLWWLDQGRLSFLCSGSPHCSGEESSTWWSDGSGTRTWSV